MFAYLRKHGKAWVPALGVTFLTSSELSQCTVHDDSIMNITICIHIIFNASRYSIPHGVKLLLLLLLSFYIIWAIKGYDGVYVQWISRWTRIPTRSKDVEWHREHIIIHHPRVDRKDSHQQDDISASEEHSENLFKQQCQQHQQLEKVVP